MVTILRNVPDHVAAFEASGTVTSEDYEKVVIPEVERVAGHYDRINFLLLLNTDIGNYDLGAAMKDIGIGFKHITQWNKLAIVSDQNWVNKLSEALGYVIPGNVRSFKKDQLQQAEDWVRTL